MIVISPTATYVRRGRPMRAAHVLSDRAPPAGSVELQAFASRLGVSPQWIRRRSTPYEHLELISRRIDTAKQAGAVRIDRHRLVEIIAAKIRAIDDAVLLAKCSISAHEVRLPWR